MQCAICYVNTNASYNCNKLDHHKFLGRNIALYSNSSTVTFKLQLLIRAGDVHPNPGPDITPAPTVTSVIPRPTYSYTAEQLHHINQHLNPKTHVPNTLWRHLVNLGINNRRPTHRGNKGKVKHSSPTPKATPIKKKVSMCLWNARSVGNKTTFITEYLKEHDIDVICITESWLNANDAVIIGECTPPTYSFMNYPRGDGTDNHGGIAVIYKTAMKFRTFKPADLITHSFEHACFTDPINGITYVVVYRPDPFPKNASDFLEEFDEFVTNISSLTSRVLILGDFNIHVDKPDHPMVKKFNACLASSGLLQHIHEPTHRSGHTLDLVISRCDEQLIRKCEVKIYSVSDHYMINCVLNQEKSMTLNSVSTCRNFQRMDHNAFKLDLASKICEIQSSESSVELLTSFDSAIISVLDKHAPIKTKSHKLRPKQPWYTHGVSVERRLRRRLERKWRKSGTDSDRKAYQNQRDRVNLLIDTNKTEFYTSSLANADKKDVFKTVNSLLNKNRRILPQSDSPQLLANDFATFFKDKVDKIRNGLDEKATNEINEQSTNLCSNMFSEFEHVSEVDVQKLVKGFASKSCALDTLPTWLLKDNLDILLPALTSIINASLSSGIFPNSLGQAIISPILKKPSMDHNALSSYRPVSNIRFVAKLIEKAAATQLKHHMSLHNLEEPYQSAYKKHNSTETALLKVKDDILKAMDKSHIVFMVLLDLSAAFDTIDHGVLLKRMKTDLGISGTALQWFESYLSDRQSRVSITNNYSDPVNLLYGLPQGSILGPLKFVIYTLPLGNIIRQHALDFHLYADDTQLYCSFDPSIPGARENAIEKLQLCIAEIQNWMTKNKLKLNESKTEFIVLGSPYYIQKLPPVMLTISDAHIKPTYSVRNLGIMFDVHMTMTKQISSLCQSSYFQIRNIRRIKRYLDNTTLHHVVRALVISRLDYGNLLLLGATEHEIDRVQRLQNNAARLVCSISRREHITPVLKELHWLPIRERIQFKLCLFVYKCFKNTAPEYLSNLLSLYTPQRTLRSALDITRLNVPRTNKVLGRKAFSVAGPRSWNNLPRAIRELDNVSQFRRSLKTHLFPC